MTNWKPRPYFDSLLGVNERGERLLVWVVAVLVVGSALLWSSPEYRERHLLLASVIATFQARRRLGPLLQGMGRAGICFLSGLLLVHAASWLGGVRQGDSMLLAGARGLEGIIGVLGLAVLAVVLLEPRWRRFGKWTALGVLGLLLAGSYVGFFAGADRFIPLGKYSFHFDQMRMVLIWPTRLLTWPLGQLAWEHTNYAAFFFALGMALLLEHIGGGGKGRGWWCLGGLLGAGVFLTASRNGWLMLLVAVPLVLVRRSPRFTLKTLALLAVSIGLGYLCLKAKLILSPPVTNVPAVVMTIHGRDLVERGSSGRLEIYQLILEEIKETRLCGKGLGAVGGPVGQLEHEHSTYMATLRGGGWVGFAGHLLVIGSAVWAAWGLVRRGVRWPAVLLVTVLGGLMFDRSTVIGLSGNYEFIAHWAAVLLPLLLIGKERGSPALHGRG